MHLRSLILSLGLAAGSLASPALAQVAPVTAIERANADAVARLYAAIAAEELAGVRVASIVDRVNGYPILMKGLARAEQIGGPREVVDGLVQVRLQISGPRAGQLLLQAVAANPDRSPVPLDRLSFLLRNWSDRTFTSTGDNVEPATRPADAVAAVADQPDATSRPIAALQAVPDRAPPTMPAAAADQPVRWRPAPAWVAGPLTATATAQSVGSPLRTARAAEQSAREALHATLRALPALDDPTKTLGDDLEHRPDLLAALDETVAAARVSSVDYRADGSVEIHLAVGGQRLWQRLSLLAR